MQKFFVNTNQIDIENNTIKIEGEDVKHIKNVLRCTVGEKIEICEKTEKPSKYVCEIEGFEQNEVRCSIVNKIEDNNESNIKIHIFQGLPKAEKMELIIQKCTELGVCEFIPTQMNRCVVKISGKDQEKKISRWQKIAEVASKQCGRDVIPHIRNIMSIKEVASEINNYDMFLLAYENENETFLKDIIRNIKLENKEIKIGIIIGPEGGIEEKEVELLENAGAKVISLGKRILRTETVAMVLTSIIMYELGDIGG